MKKKNILIGAVFIVIALIGIAFLMRSSPTGIKPNSPPSATGGLPNMSIIEERERRE